MRLKNTSPDIKQIVADGNVSAFSDLYNFFFRKLILESDRYVKDLSVAEEIVQEVFLKIWEKADDLSAINSIKSYLYRAVINASINYLKRQKNVDNHHQNIAADLTQSYIQEADEEHELVLRLYEEIDKLPTKCKEVFKLARFDGLKYKDIALQLGISERTVENHVANALKILKDKMGTKPVNGPTLSKALSLLAFF